MQWITINPELAEGTVIIPPMPKVEPGAVGLYQQILEWSGLLQLRDEVRRAGGGDLALNAIYIKACETYCLTWKCEEEEDPTAVEVQHGVRPPEIE